MQNNPEAPVSVTDLYAILAKQIKSLQETFVDTFAQQEARHYKAIKSLKKEIKEIYKNPPSATPSSRPNPINIDLQTLGGKNASKTGSLTPNSPTKAPVKRLSKRLPNPPTYSSKRSKLYSFIN